MGESAGVEKRSGRHFGLALFHASRRLPGARRGTDRHALSLSTLFDGVRAVFERSS